MPDADDLADLPELVLLPEGALFGNYLVHQCIGQGAMGSVYRAEHALLEKPVALKVMDASLLASADARQRFIREGQAAAAIKHPNVVDITDVGVCDGTPYLVMELLEGEDLQTRLERNELLSESEIASLVIPIVAALGAAHDRGVVHRDLKPSNIFLARGADGELIPKVLDFGISKRIEGVDTTDFESTPFNQLMGSPLYLPPEAVHGSRNLTAKSDQYSLGVVLYECATGRPPFAGDSLLSLLSSISAGNFKTPSQLRPNISAAMEHAILRAMNPDPALRFAHVRDLGRELLVIAGMRTQMLWGRTFGRIDLSDPPGPRTTSPIALLRVASRAPAADSRRPNKRQVLLGIGIVAAILIPNLWAARFATERAPLTSVGPLAQPMAEVPRRGAQRPPVVSVQTSEEAAASDRAALARPAMERPAHDLPAGDASDPSRWADPAAGAVAGPTSSDRARSASKRPRASGTTAEARSRRSSAADARPSVRQDLELAPEPGSDEMQDLFKAPGRSRQAAGPVLTGANEAPILD